MFRDDGKGTRQSEDLLQQLKTAAAQDNSPQMA